MANDPRLDRNSQPVTWKTHAFLAILLSLPVIALYLAHYRNGPEGMIPTGYVHGDIAYYSANARQYRDGQNSGIFYSNPFDFEADAPRIYFQAHILLLSGLQRLSPNDPGLAFVTMGLAAMVPAFFLLSTLVARVCPDSSRLAHVVLTLSAGWGGGILVLMGIAWGRLRGIPFDPLAFDPSTGWWFLNFGRNFVFPTESVYHLFTITIFTAVAYGRSRIAWAAVMALALCHPFTGLQYGLIFLCWVLAERFVFRNGAFGKVDIAAAFLPLCWTVAYYLVYLPGFAEHRAVVDQWKLDWYVRWVSMIGAYGIVAMLALVRCRTRQRFRQCFESPFERLLGIAFLISLGLIKHDLVFQSHQPLHFTRGHVWTPLCLLGLPALAEIGRAIPGGVGAKTMIALAWLGFFSLDNLVFFERDISKPSGLYVNGAQLDVFEFSNQSTKQEIIVSDQFEAIGELSAVYSKARPYMGHWSTTPNVQRKRAAVMALFESGTIPEGLEAEAFLVVTSRFRPVMDTDERFETVHENGPYRIYRHRPNAKSEVTR